MRRLLPIVFLAALVAAACGGGHESMPASSGEMNHSTGGMDGSMGGMDHSEHMNELGSPTGARPSSPAKISIVSPKQGAVVTGPVDIHISLKGGRIVEPSTTKITPTTGHVHVLVDGSVISMNYGLHETLAEVAPGTHTLTVEFVAADHFPFDPRVLDTIAFTEKG